MKVEIKKTEEGNELWLRNKHGNRAHVGIVSTEPAFGDLRVIHLPKIGWRMDGVADWVNVDDPVKVLASIVFQRRANIRNLEIALDLEKQLLRSLLSFNDREHDEA